MTVNRGEIWLADLNPTRGSEQAVPLHELYSKVTGPKC